MVPPGFLAKKRKAYSDTRLAGVLSLKMRLWEKDTHQALVLSTKLFGGLTCWNDTFMFNEDQHLSLTVERVADIFNPQNSL